jgi:taurine dioxygenase
LPDAEALKLIEEMAELIPQERFHFTHKWQIGDVLIWDNCAVQHLASFDYMWPEERRLMWRITVDPIGTE